MPGGTIKVIFLPAHSSNKLNPLSSIIEQNGGISSKKPKSFVKGLSDIRPVYPSETYITDKFGATQTRNATVLRCLYSLHVALCYFRHFGVSINTSIQSIISVKFLKHQKRSGDVAKTVSRLGIKCLEVVCYCS